MIALRLTISSFMRLSAELMKASWRSAAVQLRISSRLIEGAGGRGVYRT